LDENFDFFKGFITTGNILLLDFDSKYLAEDNKAGRGHAWKEEVCIVVLKPASRMYVNGHGITEGQIFDGWRKFLPITVNFIVFGSASACVVHALRHHFGY